MSDIPIHHAEDKWEGCDCEQTRIHLHANLFLIIPHDYIGQTTLKVLMQVFGQTHNFKQITPIQRLYTDRIFPDLPIEFAMSQELPLPKYYTVFFSQIVELDI